MTAIKSYTDIEQSRKLAEILPLESADMQWFLEEDYGIVQIKEELQDWGGDCTIPCWSLAALLNVLPKVINNETLFIETSPALWHIGYRNIYIARTDNPVDACYEMIIRLNELKML